MGAFCLLGKAQFSFSASATYTKYGGDIKKASPGAHLRGIYYATDFSLYFRIDGSYQIGTSKYSFASSRANTSVTIEDEKLMGLTINVSMVCSIELEILTFLQKLDLDWQPVPRPIIGELVDAKQKYRTWFNSSKNKH